MFGGVGSGKTLAGLALIFEHCLRRKTQGMVLRRTAREVQKVVVADILEKWSEFVVSAEQDSLTLVNGSVIHLLHGWDDEKGVKHLDGYNISCCMLSQAEGMPKETHLKMQARLRNMAGDGETLEVLEGNPDGRGWVWELFCKGVGVEPKSDRY